MSITTMTAYEAIEFAMNSCEDTRSALLRAERWLEAAADEAERSGFPTTRTIMLGRANRVWGAYMALTIHAVSGERHA